MDTEEPKKNRPIALPTIRRLPFYLNALERFRVSGQDTVSTTELSIHMGVSDPVVKKDLNILGAPGKTGVGYAVAPLLRGIERFLGWDNPAPAVLVGVGGLGSALLGRSDIRRRVIDIVAAFDVNSDLIGKRVNGVNVYAADRLIETVRKLAPAIGVLTVPERAAQRMANRLVAAGITKIWSFSAICLKLPKNIKVKREVLTSGLAELLAETQHSTIGALQRAALMESDY